MLFYFYCIVVPILHASAVKTVKTKKGWQLLVDGDPYFIKGMCYSPTKVGETPDQGTLRDWMIVDDDNDGKIDSPYQSWVDRNRNNKKDKDEPEVGDFQLLKEMGCNTIRIYHPASSSLEIQAIYQGQLASGLAYSHAPNKELLRDLFETYGIRVAMCNMLGSYVIGSGADWGIGTDYRDPEQKKKMLKCVEDMVLEFRDEPYVLLWILGNENNLAQFTHTNASKFPKEYAQFVNKVAKRIKELDPNHPVALCNGDTQLLNYYAKYAPDIDIFGTNSYRSPGFGTLWQEVATIYDKPVILTEFGLSHPRFRNGVLDEEHQAREYEIAFCDIQAHRAGGKPPRNAIGGFVYEWVDNWWQDGDPWHLNFNEQGWNHEVTGMAGQGDGGNSPFLRQLRKVYFTLKSYWRNTNKK